MADGYNQDYFWPSTLRDNKLDTRFFGTPFFLHDLMLKVRFNLIFKILCFTAADEPDYEDRLCPIHSLVKACNENMKTMFQVGWITCLYDLMSKWLFQFTCPRFFFCPRNPWPLGNEWHTIACGLIFFH